MSNRRGIGTATAAVVIIVVVIGGIGLVALASQPRISVPCCTSSTGRPLTTSSSWTSTSCVILGQPGAFYLRVLSDSGQAPLVGARVVATNEPVSCNNQPATSRTSITYATNGTEWIELPSENNGGYSISVTFSGLRHNFTARLAPVSLTCATIYMPSGKTNVTITEFGERCISGSTLPLISSVAVTNVTVRGYPAEIAVSPNMTYVSDLFNNTLTVLDSRTRAIVDTITLPGTPEFGLVVDPKTNMVYVRVLGCTNLVNATNSCVNHTEKGGIVQIDGSTNKIVKEFPINIDRMTINPSTEVLYGAGGILFPPGNSSQGFILAIDDRSGTVIANVSMSAYPLSLAADSATNIIYIGACKQISLACLGPEVIALDGATNTVRSNIQLPYVSLNFNVVVDQSTDTVYTLGETTSSLTLAIIDGTSGSVHYLSVLGTSCAGAGGGVLAVDPASHQVYAAFASQQFFLYVDGTTGQIVNMVKVTQGSQFVAFDPAAAQVYVTIGAETHQTAGHLFVLPETPSRFFVNGSLLSQGICIP